MFKMKGLGKRIAGIVLAGTMVITLLPQIELVASGVTVKGYPVYNDEIFNEIKSDKITNTSVAYRDTVYGGISSWFYLDEESRINRTHVQHCTTYTSTTKVNLGPAMRIYSANDQSWQAEFYSYLDSEIRNNPDVSLKFGATFKATNSKPSMTLGSETIGGSSLTKKKTTAVEGTLDSPNTSLTVTVQGASGTEVSGMWVAAIDNSPAKYAGISARLSGNQLYFDIKMDEELRWANSTADQYKDSMYIEFYLKNSLTNMESACLRANFERLDGDTLVFCCGDIGDELANGEFQVTRITKVNFPVISNINFAVYGVRACYDYQISYDKWNKKATYQTVGNNVTYMQDVSLDTTPITDLAGNRVELSKILLVNENLSFDELAPSIDSIRIEDANGMSREDASKIKNNEESRWPADISREEIFLGNEQGINFSLVTTEQINEEKASSVTAKLNVKDKNGNQIVLNAVSFDEEAPGTYGERTKSVIQFETFTAQTGMSMMAGYEGKAIQIIEITGDVEDKAGNNLTSIIPAPEKQIFLDAEAPSVTVEKKAAPEENGRDLELLVTISDKKENLAAGILGEYASLSLIPNKVADKGYTYNYTYKVLTTDNKELTSGTGSMSADKAGVIRWQLHGVDSYAAKVQLHFANGENITIDGIQASLSVKDIVGNQNTGAASSLDYLVDELAPVITIQPVDYTYGATKADVSVTFKAVDYSQIASAKYQWTDIAATQPNSNAWSALEVEKVESIEETISKNALETTASYKLWVQVGDDKGNTSLASTEVVVNLDKPGIYYDASAITSEPDYAPQLTVIGPAAKSDGTQATTRVTVTMGDNVYVCIVKTGETVNAFDFSDSVTWYKVKFNENKTAYTEVTQVTDNSVLKNYYGEVRVSFDAAYADLIPEAGTIDKNVTNGSYTSDTAEIKVLYASTTAKEAPTDVHNVTFGEVKDATGSNVLAADGTAGKAAILLEQIAGKDSVIAGTQFTFTLSNKLIEDWGITNIDFGRSYVELVYTKGEVETVVDTELLQNATSQTYTLPASMDYETGMYTIKVYVYQSGSDVAAEYQSLNLVLDAETVQNAGLWEYNIYTHHKWDGRMITHTGDTAPLELVGISLGDQKEIGRDNTFAYYTAGAYLLNISLQAPNTEAEYDGIKIGEIVGFRMWNSLSNMTETDLASYEFSRDAEVTEDGRVKKDYDILDPVVYEIDEFPQGSAGFIYNDYTNGRELPLVKGINTFYYQVMLSNGTVSEIRQFTFVVSDMAPSMKISVDSFENSLKPSTVAGQFRVKNITMKIEDAYSMNGGGDTYIYLHTLGNTDITRVDGSTEYYNPASFTEEGSQLYVGDKLLFNDDRDNSISYEGYFEEDYPNTTLGFIVYDEFGGAMVVAPQMGHEENKYLIDDTDWQISPFNSSSSYTDTYKDANGNVVTNSTFTKCYLSLKDDAELKCLPELVDYDSITFTFYKRVEENGEMVVKDSLTVPMVDNYAEPNLAGYMGARRDPYTGEITVYLANLVDEEPTSYWVSYDVNYKDIFGNEYTWYAGYRPYSVSSGVVSAYMTDKGIELYIGAAVAGGLDAQYIGSGGNTSRGLIQTGVFANGIYHVSYTDMFGKLHEYDYEITNGWDFGVDVEYSTLEPTMNDVTVLLKSSKPAITVAEMEGITIESNGTTAVKVTASKNVTFGFTMENSDEVHEITVDNIFKFQPTIQWSYAEEQVLTDADGTKYLYGPVTAYIIDENLDVVDSYTGLEPSYTFYPGEETSYTFKADSYYAVLGKETAKGSDLTVELPVELRNESFEVANPELPSGDTDAPAIQLRAYAQRNGVFANEQLALQVEPDKYGEMLNDYEGDTIIECFENRADTTEFLEKIGWASTYRFEIELIDDSDVKLFVKRGLYTNAPNYSIGGSDTIDGVSLNGRVLEVTDTTEFTLFAVDEKGNATAIPFNVTNVGEAPVPQVKTIYAGTQAFVYVLPPEVSNASDVTDFKLTGPTGVAIENDANSEYYGKWYMPYKQNGTYEINYSYTYKGKAIIGALEVVVDEIDDVQILSEIIKWSANKSKVATNQDVTVQLTFNKNVKEVVVPYEFKDQVNVLITGSRVTVRYEENLDAILPITAVAYNDTHITLELDAVTNIDKVAPIVTQPVITLADNGKSATVTIKTNEDALFSEENCYGTEAGDAYVYTTTVKENGSYTYKFMDKAGNITQITFTVDVIVDTALELLFNTTASDTGAVADPSDFTLRVGDTIYVKANRASSIRLNNGAAKDVAANTWQAFEITENESGLWPIVFAIDAYGNTDSALLGGVKALDKDAPVITLIKDCVYAKVGTDSADVLALLKANMTVSDADTNVTVEIDFTDKLTVEGTTAVTYTAKDSFGNVSTKTGWLRLTAAAEPEVKVDGEAVGRDSVYLGSLEDDLKLSVDTDGEPYSIVFKKGVYTTAQMKIGATVLVRDAETATSTELPFTEAGYYTICIRTQSRDEYLFIVYVD